ncbi:unnamed protein product [Calypogeia fissa]
MKQILRWGAKKANYDKAGRPEDGRSDPAKKYGVKRQCLLDLELDYWREFKPSKHNLDVMHVEKNICESVCSWLCGEKDTVAVRQDLKARGIRQHLWLKPHPNQDGRFLQYKAPYVMSEDDWKIFVSRLGRLKFPSGYAADFKKHLKKKKLGSMKTHDFHVLMQQILPICLRGLMEQPIRHVILRLSFVWRKIYARVWDPAGYKQLRDFVVLLLCDLEIYFPPAFFDVMIHLLLHIVEELKEYGPVRARSMYPLERFMKVLKDYVGGLGYRPEARMAIGYMEDESLGFLTEYMAEYEHVRTRVWNSDEEEGATGEELRGVGQAKSMPINIIKEAHKYVLRNTTIMQPWCQEYEVQKDARASDDGPFPELSDCIRQTIRDSGLIAVAEQENSGDSRGFIQMGYVGELIGIWLLDYGQTSAKIILLKGRWVSPHWTGPRATMQKDRDGFVLANFADDALLPEWKEPFIFPCQVEQAFFLDLEDKPGWRVICHKQARSRRVEGSDVEFCMDDHAAFDIPTPTSISMPHVSAEYTPLRVRESWEAEAESE